MTVAPATPRRSGGFVPLDDQTTALIYGRVSSDEQANEGVSLPAQFSEGRRYVTRHDDWIFGDEFQDVETGRRDDRADYQRLLLTVRGLALEGRRVVVVVASLDRLGRNVAERVRAYEELKALGVTIHSVREGGVVSEFTYNILAAVAQEESRKLSERVRASNRYFVNKGWHPIGRLAWGYRLRTATDAERVEGSPKKVIEPCPVEAPYVREAWERRASGESTGGIHQWAKRLPEIARGGRSLSRRAIRLHFEDAVFVGRFDDGQPGRWEPLVDQETWDRVQAALARDRRIPAQASGNYALTGLIRCFRCGSRMHGRNNTARSKYRTYRIREYICGARPGGAATAGVRCSATVPAIKVEEVALRTVGGMLADADTTDIHEPVRREWAARERAARDDDDDARRVTGLEQAIQTARRRISTASIKFLDGELDRATYDMVKADLAVELEAAEAELARLRGRTKPSALPSLDAVLAGVAGWAKALGGSAPGPARNALAVLVERIEPVRMGHGRYRVRIDWTPLGAALLVVATTARGGANYVSVEHFGKANCSTLHE